MSIKHGCTKCLSLMWGAKPRIPITLPQETQSQQLMGMAVKFCPKSCPYHKSHGRTWVGWRFLPRGYLLQSITVRNTLVPGDFQRAIQPMRVERESWTCWFCNDWFRHCVQHLEKGIWPQQSNSEHLSHPGVFWGTKCKAHIPHRALWIAYISSVKNHDIVKYLKCSDGNRISRLNTSWEKKRWKSPADVRLQQVTAVYVAVFWIMFIYTS